MIVFFIIVHCLKCHVNKKDEEPIPTKCVDPVDKYCGYFEYEGKITRKCMPEMKPPYKDGKCIKAAGAEMLCLCTSDNGNYKCVAENCKNVTINAIALEECDAQCNPHAEGTSRNDTRPTEDSSGVTTKRDPNSTEDVVASTTKEVPKPTEENAGNIGTVESQRTKNSGEATAEKTEETQNPSAKATTISGNQRVVESNQFVFAIRILVPFIISSFY